MGSKSADITAGRKVVAGGLCLSVYTYMAVDVDIYFVPMDTKCKPVKDKVLALCVYVGVTQDKTGQISIFGI